MLKILSGLMIPSSGHFSIAGFNGERAGGKAVNHIGFLPDRPPLYDDMTVRQMLSFAAEINGVSSSSLKERVDEVLQLTNLVEEADSLVAWLSHGYRQRLGIAQAIVHRPQVVILDEPISGLDPVQIVEMRNLVKAIGQEHTVLLSSHILSEISQTCDRILVMSEGKLVAQGTEAELAKTMRSNKVVIVARGEEESVRAILKSMTQTNCLSMVHQGGQILELQLEVPSAIEQEHVVKAFIEGGVGVREVRPVDSGLEDVFIHLADTSLVNAPKGVA